jgi:CheY-like chemotaxis protein
MMLEDIRVLLVEDEFLVALEAEEMLRDFGVRSVEVVNTFEKASLVAEENRFDVAVLDINLNGKLSLPIAQSLTARGIPVVFTTGYEKSRDEPEIGVVARIMKPYSATTLLAAVQRAAAVAQRC